MPTTTTDPTAAQALWALWGHLALLPNTSLLSSAAGAFGCLCRFFQGLPHPQPFRFWYSSELASPQPRPTALTLSWHLPGASHTLASLGHKSIQLTTSCPA